jgi:hypothetical protein
MHDAVLANLKRGKKEGVYRKDLNEEIIARLQHRQVIPTT